MRHIYCPNCGRKVRGASCPFCKYPLPASASSVTVKAEAIKPAAKESSKRATYILTGVLFLLSGVALALGANFILEIVWLTALGISLVILGAVMLAVGDSFTPVSPEFGVLLYKTGFDNTAVLIKKLGLKNRAVYLPASSLENGTGKAFIPPCDKPFTCLENVKELLEEGLPIESFGSKAIERYEVSKTSSVNEYEALLRASLVTEFGIAMKVQVESRFPLISVALRGSADLGEADLVRKTLGSAAASFAASAAAEVWGKPVLINSEKREGLKHTIRLEVINS